MKILPPPEIEIGVDTFASHDLLGRDKLAEQLSQAINGHSEPLVIALDDGWGSGKSYFLKLWVGEHKQKHPQTTIIYFDAFKHDYMDDVLASLVIRLEEQFPEKQVIETLKQSAIALSKIGASYLTAGVSDEFLKHWEKQQQSLWENEHKRIKAMDNFTKALKGLAQEGQLVFIVDELDRCRPDYPLKLLEIIKHFFWVDNVHFILGVNSIALENSVKARHGKGFDASVYLKKFVNLRMRFLPIYEENSNHSLAFEYFDAFCDKRIKKGESPEKANAIIDVTKKLLKQPDIAQQLSLRDIDQLFTRLSLFPNDEYSKELREVQYFLAFVAILETVDKKYFDSLIRGDFTGGEIEKFIRFRDSSGMTINPFSNPSINYDDVVSSIGIVHSLFLIVGIGYNKSIVGKMLDNYNKHGNVNPSPVSPDDAFYVPSDNHAENPSDFAEILKNKLKAYFTTFEIS